ncbi:MAG: hypothetical protein HYV63_21500 [Candidatus Schekmanbacteria bacterium]|nr:hypothetical protein [Candidatus Schekmanbacteria bacterium]
MTNSPHSSAHDSTPWTLALAGLLGIGLLFASTPIWAESFAANPNGLTCNSGIFGNTHTTYRAGTDGSGSVVCHYNAWCNQGVHIDNMESTYVSVIHDPGISAVKNLVLFVAGQQGIDAGQQDFPSAMTGQDENWRSPGMSSAVWCSDNRSQVQKFIYHFTTKYGSSTPKYSSGTVPFVWGETFIAATNDAAFYHGASSGTKTDIVDAFNELLLGQAYATNVEKIYLAGASRGGALAYRLAKKIRDNSAYDGVPIIVTSVDGVLNSDEGEGASESEYVDNPYDSGEHGWRTYLQDYHYDTNWLRIYQVVTGNLVATSDARGWATPSSNEDDISDFYRQEWFNEGINHQDACRNYGEPINPTTTDTQSERGLSYLKQALQELAPTLGDTSWKVSHGANSAWQVYRSGVYARAQDIHVGDFDGDGFDDLLLPNGNTTSGLSWSRNNQAGQLGGWSTLKTGSYTGASTDFYAIGQFNGTANAKADILYTDGYAWRVLRDGVTWDTVDSSENIRLYWGEVLIGDWDGDGDDDMAWIDSADQLNVRKTSGGAPITFGPWDWLAAGCPGVSSMAPYPATTYYRVGNFDGSTNPSDEIFCANDYGEWYVLNPGESSPDWQLIRSNVDSSVDPSELVVGELTGDDQADILWMSDSYADAWDYWSANDSFWTNGFAGRYARYSGLFTHIPDYFFKFGRFNGDGKMDVLYPR